MTPRLFAAVVLMAALACACSKKNETPSPVTKADYYQLTPGNYWIYTGVRIDTSGVEVPYNDIADCTYIEKDTLIRGLQYFKYVENYLSGWLPMRSFLRDSSGYLVDQSGRILASDVNFSDTLRVDNQYPELYMGYLWMIGKDSAVSVPASLSVPSITAAMQVVPSAPNTAQLPVRRLYDVYGKGIGKIKTHSFFFSHTGFTHETRLVRYHVE